MENQPHIDTALHQILSEAIRQWIKFTGVDPAATSLMGSHEINTHRTYEQLQEMQELDKTGLSTAMLLRTFVEEYSKDIAFTAQEIINHPEKVEEEIKGLRVLIRTLNKPEIDVPTKDFMEITFKMKIWRIFWGIPLNLHICDGTQS